jgi:AmmeMemoRadiSam system protein A
MGDNSVQGRADDQSHVLEQHGLALLKLAVGSIRHGLRHGVALQLEPTDFPDALRVHRASFVTLRRDGFLRGCVGSAHRPLVQDVAANGFAAAFADDRFPPLSAEEARGLTVSVSVLSAAEPLQVATEQELLSRLRPHCDGLIIDADGCRALFLPQVWEHYPEASAFVGALKTKAGLPRDLWAGHFRVWRFTSESVTGVADAAPNAAGGWWR